MTVAFPTGPTSAASPLLPARFWQASVLVKILLLFLLAWNSRFVMDEFWHMSQARYLFAGFFDGIVPEKAVGYAVFFKLAHLMGSESVSIMLAGRLLSAGLALGLVIVVYHLTLGMKRSSWEALAAILLLLCFSTFMERGFRLRSEPLAILFAALALLVAIRGDIDRPLRLLGAGLLCGLAFVTTQKAAYFNFALGMGLVADAFLSRRPLDMLRRGWLLLLGWAMAIVAYGLVFGGLRPWIVLEALFLGPLEVARTAQTYYTGLQGFVLQTLQRNALPYLLCFGGLALVLARIRTAGPALRIHAVFTAIITLLVFTHNQPWPYVFTMALPFLASYGPIALDALARRSISARALPILLVLVVAGSFARNIIYLSHDNRDQLVFLREAEAILPPEGTYFDGIGMLPSRTMAPYIWLDAMGIAKTLKAGETSTLMEAISRQPPDMVILTYRTDALLPLMSPVLQDAYTRAGGDLLLRGTGPGPSATDLRARQNLFEGIYGF